MKWMNEVQSHDLPKLLQEDVSYFCKKHKLDKEWVVKSIGCNVYYGRGYQILWRLDEKHSKEWRRMHRRVVIALNRCDYIR